MSHLTIPKPSDIRAVVFDWGGVLIELPVAQMWELFARALGVDEKKLAEAVLPSIDNFQNGRIPEQTFWKQTCARLEVPAPKHNLWENSFLAAYRPVPATVALARRLRRAGYLVGLLSNTESPSIKVFRRKHARQFDVAVFSCEEGVCKPSPEIYRRLTQRLGLNPSRILFVDDSEGNVRAARRSGMRAVRYLDAGQAEAAILAALGA